MAGNGEARGYNISRSCVFCRNRKIRCNAQKPSCSSCVRHKQDCVYVRSAPTARPTNAVINELRTENERLRTLLQQSKEPLAHADDVVQASDNSQMEEAQAPTRQASATASTSRNDRLADLPLTPAPSQRAHESTKGDRADPDMSPYLWTDERGNLNVFGPSSALQATKRSEGQQDPVVLAHVQNALLANAVLSRQQEHRLLSNVELDGVPIDLATHLLDLHWNRQHHTFLLTYRPAIMRDILHGGRYVSNFLLNAIFACSSKFSWRTEVLENPNDPNSTGGRFFRRCDELLAQQHLLLEPSLPTIVGLMLLGSTYNARGMTSKSWLFSGYATRMIYDLGLHLDRKITHENAEEVEIYRRVFWGSFICDKLQGLYFGRPVAIKLRDAHVSLKLNDIMEENELWSPYVDSALPRDVHQLISYAPPGPIHSVSCFQQLCLLFKIVDRIIDNFYVVGTTAVEAQASLQPIDDSLNHWEADLPESLQLDTSTVTVLGGRLAAPNLILLHVIYNAVIILLHRPLVAGGHLQLTSAVPAASWRRCTAAARNISHLAMAYRASYTLRSGPYLMAYGIYVASTIHVRNAAVVPESDAEHHSLFLGWNLRCLEELSTPNPGVARVADIIKKLMSAKGVEVSLDNDVSSISNSSNMVGNVFPNNNILPDTLPSPNFWPDMFPTATQNSSSTWEETFREDALYGFLADQSCSFDMIPEHGSSHIPFAS